LLGVLWLVILAKSSYDSFDPARKRQIFGRRVVAGYIPSPTKMLS